MASDEYEAYKQEIINIELKLRNWLESMGIRLPFQSTMIVQYYEEERFWVQLSLNSLLITNNSFC